MASIILDRATRFAREYRDEANSAWDAVKREHDQAMIVCTIEDAVASGCFVLEDFPRVAERWHRLVSADVARYNERTHQQLREVEAEIVESSTVMLKLIDEAERLGYEVARADEFRQLAQRLFQLTGMSPNSPGAAEVREAKRIALDEYRAGKTTAISDWGG